MHDRVVGHAVAEGVVALAVGLAGARLLLGLVGAAARLLAGLAGGRGAGPHGVGGDAPAARALGQRLQLVGGAVDRLQVPFVLDLLAGRRQVGMPALGQPAPGQLHRALVEWGVDLQQEKRLLDVEDRWHDL